MTLTDLTPFTAALWVTNLAAQTQSGADMETEQ